MTDNAILIQRRGRFKGVVTRVKAFAEAIQPTTTLEEITTRLSKIEEAWVGFGEIEDHLLSTPGQTSELEEFEGKYYDTKALLMRAIKERSPPRTEQLLPSHPDLHSTFNNTVSTEQLGATINSMLQSQQSFFENFNRTRQSQSSQISADLRLPRINIPNFSGDYKQWPSFQDLFETAVDKNESLNPCQKLQYLKGLLKDEAAALIRHLAITDSNYQEAWCKLKERYDKKRHITVAMIKTFLEQNTVSQPSSKQLRSMHDAFDEVIRGLRALGPNAEARDPWLIIIALNKLDSETRELWSRDSAENEFPTFNDFLKFLNRRCDSLEACISISKRAPATKILHVTSSTKTQSCLTCKGSHYLYQCPDFKAKPVSERKPFVVSNSLCFNCLQPGHSVKSCRSNHRCFHCKRIHHSLLHDTVSAAISHQSTDSSCNNAHNNNQQALHFNQNSNSSINPNQTTSTNQALSSFNTSVIVNPYSNKSLQTFTGTSTASLLPTAIVNAPDINGKLCSCRILLDSGSQVSFISEACVKRLALKRVHSRLSISGISETNSGFTRGKLNIHLFSRINPSEGINVEVHIMSKLTSLIPAVSFTTDNLSNIQKHLLADPYFNKSSTIDIILGADKFFAILKQGQFQDQDYPIAQNTIFGWVLCGIVPTRHQLAINAHSNVLQDIDRSLRRFWEAEDLYSSRTFLTEEETNCEVHFKKHTYRDTTGRFVVSLPFKDEAANLGSSEANAIKRLHAIEQRFKRDESYKNHYIAFMAEYMKLGHMERIPDNEIKVPSEKCFYLPHHAVFKGHPNGKIRVVFDGSCKTVFGKSLNDCLLVGPTIQRDLFSILINFRKHPVAITGDIEKMYRQILINPTDRNYQRIVWRKDTADLIQHYRLTTVTYGTSAASFLATRALMQIAEDHQDSFPTIAAVIKNDFYVDDLLTGAGSVTEALELQTMLTNILQKNGFNLTKWRSNCTELMKNSTEKQHSLIITDKPECIKILGIEWDHIQDTFFFNTFQLSNDPPTKRRILSESSRIFDPLGWLSPVVISVKILFQQLWVQQLDWDDPIPRNTVEKWNDFKANLSAISKIHIPRLIRKYLVDVQLHGFCDASELAYGAVVYCRTMNSEGEVFMSLIAAKTKVAPLKQISLPRLELCGAHLLSKLMTKISQSMESGNITMHAWTDSSIVLSWLSDIPRRWKTYVANRTAEILDSIPRNCWKHIASADNLADCASRGISPAKLPTFDLWWQGPSWLKLDMSAWPKAKLNDPHMKAKDEERVASILSNHQEVSENDLLINFARFSSWYKLTRTIGYVLRFIANTRKQSHHRSTGLLSTQELQESRNIIIKTIQPSSFPIEIKCIFSGKPLSNKSPLIKLCPFIDKQGILRVGGRIQASNLSFNAKHPIILPRDQHVTKLIVREMHCKYLHPGPTLLVHIIRQHFWIIGLRKIVKQVTHECITCFRYSRKTNNQLMGNLPEHRITISRPFSQCGIDFAGPITTCIRPGRGARTSKAYIALFVCFTTKALHLELVGNLTAEAFVAALRRFLSRRGYPTDIYCDNGTNLVGGSNCLAKSQKLALSFYANNHLVNDFLSQNCIKWHFIPPASPHFGGLWEAGVKSVKTHLRRVIGDTILSFEEVSTLLAQVEAILNSRPLCPSTDDIETIDALTPSHFLIGEVLTTIPEPDVTNVNPGRLNRWQQVQAMMQGFWKRWSRDYLTSLQQRPKWYQPKTSLQKDELVIVSDNNVPPSKWIMGRIYETHPGKDNMVRVVTVKTTRGLVKRPITKIHRLPIDSLRK